MTALYPSREDPELNARALAVLERDKANEAACLMDGAWTGHPDQNAIAVAQFPASQSARSPSVAVNAASRPASLAGRRGRDDDRGNARRRSHRHSLSQRRARRARCEPARRVHGRPRDRPNLPVDDRAASPSSGSVLRRRRSERCSTKSSSASSSELRPERMTPRAAAIAAHATFRRR